MIENYVWRIGMFSRRWGKLRKAFLLFFFIMIWFSSVATDTIYSQSFSQAKEASSSIVTPHNSHNWYKPALSEEDVQTLDPEHNVIVTVKAASDEKTGSQEGAAPASIWLTLFALFLGGLALNLTPCVYPLIPITVSYFGGKSERIRGYIIVHGIVYMFGLAMTNSLLGLSAALSGGMLGFALQNPFVLIFVAGVMVAMSLSFFGLWELRAPFWLTRVASRNYAGFFGTFFMGLTLGIVAAPCIGPFILGLLIYVGQTGDPFFGFLYFFVLSIGLGLPLSVLAVFSGAITRLPKSGDWMLWIRKLMGWVLLGMAAFMISPLVSQFFGKQWLLAGVSVAAGIHLGWLDTTGKKLKIFPYFKKVVGIILVVGGIIYLALASQHVGKIEWIPYDQSILEKAAEEKKLVIIDFYADWCGPCVAMEREVFSDPEVIKLSSNVITMRLDLTRSQPFHDALMRKYQIRGIPTAVFINQQGIEEKRLRAIGFVGKDEFLKRLRLFLAKSPSSQE
jgi:thiol:disulfide interchange protein DsbD